MNEFLDPNFSSGLTEIFMPSSVPEFRFSPLTKSDVASGDRVVTVRSGVRQKRRLLGILARGLEFPDYFGWNWDALADCLTDLSFVPAESRVAIVHSDVPFVDGSNARRVYLEILRDAVTANPHRMIIAFPESSATAVVAALAPS